MIKLSKFGTLLVSRPAGREAYLVAKAYLLSQPADEIEIDFSGVQVMTPSWLDEFITPIRQEFGNKVQLSHTDNPSVQASLKILNTQTG